MRLSKRCITSQRNKLMARYDLGKKYIFISQNYKKGESYSFVYTPWNGDCDLVNEVIVAECIEVHSVPIEYSESMGTGYVFKDQHNRIWHCQYPVAHYGQISDDMDRKLVLHAEGDIEKYQHFLKYRDNEKEKFKTPKFYYYDHEPTLISDFVSNVHRFCIKNAMERRSNDEVRKQCNSLEEYIADMTNLVEKEANCEVIIYYRMISFDNKNTYMFGGPISTKVIFKE